MLSFEKESLKKWNMKMDDKHVFTLNLMTSSITNKFNIVSDFIQNVSKVIGQEFDDWFLEFLTNYKARKDFATIVENIDKLKGFVDKYIDESDLDFSKFVDVSKAKKGTILFMPDEIEMIIRASGYLKLYSVISNSQDMQLSRKLHGEAYNMIITDIVKSEVAAKIFNVVKTKTYKYNMTDKYMWEYIKMIQCKSIDVHTVEIFNFIMNSILVLCEEDKNPITYFVGVVDESVKWFLRSVYKKTVIYDDSISTEDIHGMNIDNLKTYSYNDTLGRLKGIAYEKIYQDLDKSSIMLIDEDNESDKNITEFQNRILDVEFISPLCDCLVFPILSKMTNIPYTHFTTLSPEHATILSLYVKRILEKVFKSEYPNLFTLLEYFPTTAPAIATTYKIKNVNDDGGFIQIQNNVANFFGFSTKILPYKIMSYFVGRSSRVNFQHVLTGKKLGGIPLSKVESDVVKFYTLFFSGALDEKIEEMRNYMQDDF